MSPRLWQYINALGSNRTECPCLQELPDDLTSEQISELESDLENSNLNERALCRLVFGPTQVGLSIGAPETSS
jgi:hypothetical protein